MRNAVLAPAALIGAALVVPSPAAAQAAPARDHRWEVAIVLGVSLLSVDDDFGLPISIDAVETLDAFFPLGRVELPISLDLRQRRRLGGGFLQGFQLSRRLARRGWLEAGFVIGSQKVRSEVSFRCPGDVCALTPVSNRLVEAGG